jgi:nucleoside-diphosphate-sugar epimerase
MPQSVLILGARGYIGGRVTAAFRAAGHDTATDADSHAELGRITSAEPAADLIAAAAAADVIVNVIGRAHVRREENDVFWASNVFVPLAVARAASLGGRTYRVVHVSSLSVHEGGVGGNASGHGPAGAYGASKAAGELLVVEACERYGLEWVVLRPAGVYGADAPGAWGSIWRMVAAGRAVPVPSQGVRYDIVSVERLAAVAVAAATSNATSQVLDVADPTPATLRSYVGDVSEVTGTPARVFRLPSALLRLAVRVLDGVAAVARLSESVRVRLETFAVQRPIVAPPQSDGPGGAEPDER